MDKDQQETTEGQQEFRRVFINEDENKEHLYELLGVTSKATKEEIRNAFKALSAAFENDEDFDEETREKAKETFAEIKQAYDILINESTRNLYDLYGLQAAIKYKDMQVGNRIMSRDEFLRDLLKIRPSNVANRRIQSRVGHYGSVMTLFDARHCYDEEERCWYYPDLDSISIKQVYKFPFTGNFELRAIARIITLPNDADGSISLKYKRIYSPYTFIEYTLTKGFDSTSLRAKIWRRLSEFNTGEIKIGTSGTPLEFTFKRKLSHTNVGSTTVSFDQNNPSMRLGLLDERSNIQTEAGVTAFRESFSVDIKSTVQINERVTIGTTLNVMKSSNEPISDLIKWLKNSTLNITGYIERTISQLTKVHLAFRVTPVGAYLSLGVTRLGQVYQLPILITSVLSPISLLKTIGIPFAAFYLFQQFVLERRRKKKLESRKVSQRESVKGDKERAQSLKQLMEEEVSRKMEDEDKKKGLVIVQAFYGLLGDSDIESNENNPYIDDVTLPMQYFVKDSQLKLPKGTKANLVGFYDPCPGEEKELEVTYLFKNQMHKVRIKDEEPLRIPLKSHLFEA